MASGSNDEAAASRILDSSRPGLLIGCLRGDDCGTVRHWDTDTTPARSTSYYIQSTASVELLLSGLQPTTVCLPSTVYKCRLLPTALPSTVYRLPPTAYRLPRLSLERVPINGREGSTNVGYSLEGQMLGSLTPSIHVTGFHQTGSPFRDVQQNLAGNTETIVQTSPGENQLFRTFTLPSSFLPPSFHSSTVSSLSLLTQANLGSPYYSGSARSGPIASRSLHVRSVDRGPSGLWPPRLGLSLPFHAPFLPFSFLRRRSLRIYKVLSTSSNKMIDPPASHESEAPPPRRPFCPAVRSAILQ
jgi:hypothetical protein